MPVAVSPVVCAMKHETQYRNLGRQKSPTRSAMTLGAEQWFVFPANYCAFVRELLIRRLVPIPLYNVFKECSYGAEF